MVLSYSTVPVAPYSTVQVMHTTSSSPLLNSAQQVPDVHVDVYLACSRRYYDFYTTQATK